MLAMLALLACSAAPVPPQPDAAPPPSAEPVRVLWSMQRSAPAFSMLWGVDPAAHSAWVAVDDTRHVPRDPASTYLVVEIDSREGVERSRWTAQTGKASPQGEQTYGRAWPLADDADDIARLAAIAGALPVQGWHASPLPSVAPDGSAFVHHAYGPDGGDWLIRRGRRGQDPQRIASFSYAAYHPVWSPDSKRVAYNARVPDRSGGDPYRLFIEGPDGRVELPEIRSVHQLDWTADGRALLAMDNDGLAPPCLRRVELATREVKPLLCWEACRPREGSPACADDDVGFALDPTRTAGVFYGQLDRGSPDQRLLLRWFSLPDGREIDRAEMPTGRKVSDILDGGVLVIPAREGLRLVDRAHGREALLEGQISPAATTGQDGEQLLVLRRSPPDRIELLSIDVQALLSEDP